MEADEVYSELNDKIGDVQSKVDELQSTIGSLQSSIADQKSAIDQINSVIKDLKPPDNKPVDDLVTRLKAIEEANAAAEKRAQEQAGLVGKLAAQVDDAAKTIGNFPETAKAIATKAWEDGKKEILNIWEDSKKQLMSSLSDYTTKAIKDAKKEVYEDVKNELWEMVLADVKKIEEEEKSKS
ncbi:MAG TPA: hypothetical protein VFJ85_17870 [Acidimicrobiales bacterium]|nr:hypothetical protein [Acidimicrobiales bacterium]